MSDTRIGIITSVLPKPDEKQVYVNVVTGPNREPREVPFMSPKAGWWVVPQAGQAVEIAEVEGDFVARFPHSRPSFSMPTDLSEGDFSMKFNDGTEIRLAKQGDGSFNLSITADGDITINGSGNISVTGTSDVTVDGGNVLIDGIDFDQHTHNYVDSTDTGSSTKTTDPPT